MKLMAAFMAGLALATPLAAQDAQEGRLTVDGQMKAIEDMLRSHPGDGRHGPWSGWPRDRVERRISVSGTGEAEAAPDIARFVFGTEFSEADLATASEKSRLDAARIREALRAGGVKEEDIRTLHMSVEPVMEYHEAQRQGALVPVLPKVVGYTARIALEATLRDLEAAGGLVDGAVKAGASRVEGPIMEIDNPEKLSDQARARAMEDARRRADVLAQAGGFRIGPVVTVTEMDGGMPMPYARGGAVMAMAQAAPGTPSSRIDPGLATVSTRVDVVFEIRTLPEGDKLNRIKMDESQVLIQRLNKSMRDHGGHDEGRREPEARN